MSALDSLKSILGEISDLQHAEAVSDWDSRVSMPPEGAEARANVVATLTRITHDRFVSVYRQVHELIRDEVAIALQRTH